MKRLLPRALMAPAVLTLFLWMIVPLLMTLYFSFVNYNLLQPGEHAFAGIDLEVDVVEHGGSAEGMREIEEGEKRHETLHRAARRPARKPAFCGASCRHSADGEIHELHEWARIDGWGVGCYPRRLYGLRHGGASVIVF